MQCVLARTDVVLWGAATVLRRRPSQSDLALATVFPSHPVLSELVKIILLHFTELIAGLSPGHFEHMGLEEFRSHTSWLSFIIYVMYLVSISWAFKTTLVAFSCRGGVADTPVLAAGYLLKQLPAAFCTGCSTSSKQPERHQLFSTNAHNHVSRRCSAQTLMNLLSSGLCWQVWQHWWYITLAHFPQSVRPSGLGSKTFKSCLCWLVFS